VPLRLVVAEQIAALGLFALDDHLDRVAGLQLRLAGVIENLLQRNQAFGLEPTSTTTCLSVSLMTVPVTTLSS
jgi:hypothetical protein